MATGNFPPKSTKAHPHFSLRHSAVSSDPHNFFLSSYDGLFALYSFRAPLSRLPSFLFCLFKFSSLLGVWDHHVRVFFDPSGFPRIFVSSIGVITAPKCGLFPFLTNFSPGELLFFFLQLKGYLHRVAGPYALVSFPLPFSPFLSSPPFELDPREILSALSPPPRSGSMTRSSRASLLLPQPPLFPFPKSFPDPISVRTFFRLPEFPLRG